MVELTERQMQIIQLVKQNEPIIGEQIAEELGVSRPTIRSDLSVLVMLGFLDAKPKVGYFLGKRITSGGQVLQRLNEIVVKDVQAMPVIVRETATVHDAVVTLFLENVGSLIVADQDSILQGVISRKDLLKVTLGNAAAGTMPVSLVMTRIPNVVTISPEETVAEAARRMIHRQVDSLPVVIPTSNGDAVEVVGRVTKTTIIKVFLDLATKA